MPMYMNEIEHIFDEYNYAYIFKAWKNSILDVNLQIHLNPETLHIYLERFDLEEQSFIEFTYFYQIMNTVEERRKWPPMNF